MFSPHLLAKIFLSAFGLTCLGKAIAFGQTQSFRFDPTFPTLILGVFSTQLSPTSPMSSDHDVRGLNNVF